MAQGFIIDEGYGKKSVSTWVAGAPRKSFWFGLRLGGSERLEMSTYRCNRCGYLESYA